MGSQRRREIDKLGVGLGGEMCSTLNRRLITAGTVAEKGHQLLLPFGDSAMERCNGSTTQWKCAMEARN